MRYRRLVFVPAAVMGTGCAWFEGRPPLDGAQTPLHAKCH
jgi:hypothetical protein